MDGKKIVSRFKDKLVKKIKNVMVDLMIILLHLKLDKFCCIEIMNYLNMICYHLFYNQNIFFL